MLQMSKPVKTLPISTPIQRDRNPHPTTTSLAETLRLQRETGKARHFGALSFSLTSRRGCRVVWSSQSLHGRAGGRKRTSTRRQHPGQSIHRERLPSEIESKNTLPRVAELEPIFQAPTNDVAEKRRRDGLLQYSIVSTLDWVLTFFQQARGYREGATVFIWEINATLTH
ncbi:hypothetical protein BDM02DRAFT_1068735 [Thelephora ganbajun]|uniref:Uncharacterized protein n=1 Tax=Thelephora ganbajun TaxID=370292 RepID=A0ACB6Z3L9_THEGA|nr:hypothetical protein BDM02DRAFT_1068735 [Thelephora ganbajun]